MHIQEVFPVGDKEKPSAAVFKAGERTKDGILPAKGRGRGRGDYDYGYCQRRRGAMCSGTSDPNLSPKKWSLRQGQAMNFFNFYKLSEKILGFKSSFAVFTISFF